MLKELIKLASDLDRRGYVQEANKLDSIIKKIGSEEYGEEREDHHPGVTFYEDDREKGPFAIRIGGTNEFVSLIDPDWKLAWPPGKIEVVKGWEDPKALRFDTMDEALKAADQVWDIEGAHTSIEALSYYL
jgi:hypothetical protein